MRSKDGGEKGRIYPKHTCARMPSERRTERDKKGRQSARARVPSLSHYLIVMFRETMDLQRERVPNRRIQADTKTRKVAIAEMASAMRSPVGPLRRERTSLVVGMGRPRAQPDSQGRAVTCGSPRCSCCRPRRAGAGGSRGAGGQRPQPQSSRGMGPRITIRPGRSHSG